MDDETKQHLFMLETAIREMGRRLHQLDRDVKDIHQKVNHLTFTMGTGDML